MAIVTAQTNGYSAELERTFFMGSVPDEAKKVFDVTMEARATAFELIKPGIRADEVDRKVLSIIKMLDLAKTSCIGPDTDSESPGMSRPG